jgi:PilZ domain
MNHDDRRAAAAADPSAAKRDSLFLNANLRRVGDARILAVRVRNISAGGLMVEVAEPLGSDDAVEVEVRGIGWIRGRVAWHTEGRTGIAFDNPIDPQRARKPVSGGGAEPRGPLSVSLR